MRTSNRKSLDQSLAAEFVFGQKELDFKPDSAATETKTQPLSQQQPSAEKTVRFTVDLSVAMHKKLSMRAAEQGRKKAVIVRELLERALESE